MAHNHSHGEASKNIATVFFLNSFFVVVEVVGGIFTNSIAILTDALHDFGDCLSLGMAWFLQKKSTQGRDSHYSYGYKRFSLLGSVFLSGVLTVSSVIVIIEASKRIAAPEPIDAKGMLWLAVAGIVINGSAALRVKRGESLNERSVFLHIMEDVLGWVAVLVVSIVMMFVEVPVLDPILSIAISVWVLSNVWRNMRSAFKIFLQAVPDEISVERLKADLEGVEGVVGVHDLHVWSLDGQTHVMTLHVVSDSACQAILKEQILAIALSHHIDHTTIEFEPSGTHCTTDCDCHADC